MKAMVFGAGGFVGNYVYEQFGEAGHEVAGVYHHLDGRDGFEADVTEMNDVREVIEAIRPEVVVNCAGSMPTADRPPQYEQGTRTILQALHESRVPLLGNVVIIGSSSVYGAPDELPVSEDAELRPQGQYALAKYAEEKTALHAGEEYGLPVVVTRLFNMLGKNMPMKDMLPQVIAQIDSHVSQNGFDNESDLRLDVRQLHARRDYFGIRDAARAIVTLATADSPEHQVYNVGSGRQTSNEEMLRIVLRNYGLQSEPADLVPQPQPTPEELPPYPSQADIGRISALGWRPQETLEAVLAECVTV